MPLSRRDLLVAAGLVAVLTLVGVLVGTLGAFGTGGPATRVATGHPTVTPTSTSVYAGPTPTPTAVTTLPAAASTGSPTAPPTAPQTAGPSAAGSAAPAVPSQSGLRAQVQRDLAARAQADMNPLAAGPWAVDRSTRNGLYPAYAATGGATRALMSRIAERSRASWFTEMDSNATVGAAVRAYIAAQQAEYGPDALVQMTVFREWPDGESGRGKPLSRDEQASYRQWVDNVANAIGTARVALVLEPDLGLNAAQHHTADPAVRLGLVRYAAQRLSALDRTSVYLDASDSDWLSIGTIVPMLEAAGVQYARGIALGATHYSSVPSDVDYGAQVVQTLAADGIAGKHVVIDTADNGHPFTWTAYRDTHPGMDFDNAVPCQSPTQAVCDALGIPPTPNTSTYPGLSAAQVAEAQQYVDAYLWFGRPWLIRQAAPFSLSRSVEVARFTPFG